MSLLKYIVLTAFISMLAACGGGGGGGTPASPETFQLRQALANDFTDVKAYPFKLTGTSIGLAVTGSGTITQSAISATTFEGTSARQKVQTTSTSATVAGPSGPIVVPISASVETLIVDSASVPIGYTSASAYGVPLVPLAIPVTAKVGDTGTFGTITLFSSSAKSVSAGTLEYTYSLTADTASTAILSINSTQRTPARAVVGTQTSSYRISPAGAITRLAITGTTNSGGNVTTLTFTF